MEQQENNEQPVKPTRMKFSEKLAPENHRDYLDMDTDEEEFGHQETPEPLDEVPPEPDKPQFTIEELDQLVELTKDLTILPNLPNNDWDTKCVQTIREFFRDPTHLVLTIFFRKSQLTAKLGYPGSDVDCGLAYFLREAWQVYRANNFAATVSFGSVCERTEVTILRFVEGLYAPLAFKKQHWSTNCKDIVKKNEIFSNLNEFLTRAIDLSYRPMGMLMLYTPWEGIRQSRNTLSEKDEAELIDRLDRVANTWIRQIREVLVQSPIVDDQQLRDVHAEFDFWHSRYENLACISEQLKSNRLRFIVKRLKKVQSPSVKQLKLLAIRVDRALDQTKSNLSFLHIILEYCRTFDEPGKIQQCLPSILLVVRFTWSESIYYNILQNIERLLCSLSIHVVKVCIGSVTTNFIFDDPKKCREIMNANLLCCQAYSIIYENIIDNCLKCESSWKVDKNKIFKSITAFERRCQDVLAICDAILIYGGLNKINFGGTRGNYHEMQYNQVKNFFSHIINEMRVCSDYALDINKVQWFQDIANFMNNVNELESTIKNVFTSLFQEVTNVDMGIETLYTLSKFQDRKGLQDMLHDKWTKVWEIFREEIQMCLLSSLDHQIKPDEVKFKQSEESMMQDIYKNYLMRLRKMMINASDWLGDCDIQHEILSKCP